MTNDVLPAPAVKKATNLVRDARLSVMVGLIRLLGLIFVLRLVQWYLLRRQYPGLGTDGSDPARAFRSALPRLWFAVLFWPGLVLFIIAYFSVA